MYKRNGPVVREPKGYEGWQSHLGRVTERGLTFKKPCDHDELLRKVVRLVRQNQFSIENIGGKK
jgi:2C-methyl-D-erythritol 2,4-cyclodiphosphate synthase